MSDNEWLNKNIEGDIATNNEERIILYLEFTQMKDFLIRNSLFKDQS